MCVVAIVLRCDMIPFVCCCCGEVRILLLQSLCISALAVMFVCWGCLQIWGLSRDDASTIILSKKTMRLGFESDGSSYRSVV